eukprot:1399994-Rhodomonas_salina.1
MQLSVLAYCTARCTRLYYCSVQCFVLPYDVVLCTGQCIWYCQQAHRTAEVGTGLLYAPSIRCYALCCTDLPLSTTQCAVQTKRVVLCDVRIWCYALSNTDLAYGATSEFSTVSPSLLPRSHPTPPSLDPRP